MRKIKNQDRKGLRRFSRVLLIANIIVAIPSLPTGMILMALLFSDRAGSPGNMGLLIFLPVVWFVFPLAALLAIINLAFFLYTSIFRLNVSKKVAFASSIYSIITLFYIMQTFLPLPLHVFIQHGLEQARYDKTAISQEEALTLISKCQIDHIAQDKNEGKTYLTQRIQISSYDLTLRKFTSATYFPELNAAATIASNYCGNWARGEPVYISHEKAKHLLNSCSITRLTLYNAYPGEVKGTPTGIVLFGEDGSSGIMLRPDELPHEENIAELVQLFKNAQATACSPQPDMKINEREG